MQLSLISLHSLGMNLEYAHLLFSLSLLWLPMYAPQTPPSSIAFHLLLQVLALSLAFSTNGITSVRSHFYHGFADHVHWKCWAELAEARICESQSHRFKGPCVRGSNCASVCQTEGFPGGLCRGFRRRCFCVKTC